MLQVSVSTQFIVFRRWAHFNQNRDIVLSLYHGLHLTYHIRKTYRSVHYFAIVVILRQKIQPPFRSSFRGVGRAYLRNSEVLYLFLYDMAEIEIDDLGVAYKGITIKAINIAVTLIAYRGLSANKHILDFSSRECPTDEASQLTKRLRVKAYYSTQE